MTNYRTFGTWLRAYQGDDPVGDLRDDFKDHCRWKNIKASSIKTGDDMESLMYSGLASPCEGALDALEEACILYGDPWRKDSEDEDEDDDY
tara:strand:+ start:708 stop:980 length:273 start_codon:yes stop_codon:yes gene_type:complete